MNHKRLITVFSLVSMLAHPVVAAAQRPLNFEMGFRFGIPMTESLSSSLTGVAGAFSSASSEKPGYAVGPSFGVLFDDRIAVEFEAIYKPVRFYESARTGPSTQSYSTIRGSSWEFPLLANYRFLNNPIRPFGGGGFVLGTTLNGTIETRTVDLQTGGETLSAGPFSGSIDNLGLGLVVNGGLEWRHSRFVIRPEFRYTRRPDATQSTFLFRTPNQFEYLIGFSVLARSADGTR